MPADLVLSGHLHLSHTGSMAVRYPLDGFGALVVQAGTATSTRGRGEVNTFNVVRCDSDVVSVERLGWDASLRRFARTGKETFRYAERGLVGVWPLRGMNRIADGATGMSC